MGNHYEDDYCQIAAEILTGRRNAVGLLDYRFINFLTETAKETEAAGGKLISRQVIALAISTWEMVNKLPACPSE
jgi:hypothetical protein